VLCPYHERILVGYNSSNRNHILYVPTESRYIQQAEHVDCLEKNVSENNNTTQDSEEVENLCVDVEETTLNNKAKASKRKS